MEEILKHIHVETAYTEVNVCAIVTPTGVVCIDVPSYARDARDWAARMHRLSPYPVQQIILTDASGDRILNTRWLNAPILMQQYSAEKVRSYEKKYPQTLIESLSVRQPHRSRELSNGPVEHPNTSFSDEIVLYKHGIPIVLKHTGGPSQGTCWVILPDRKFIFAGDTLMINMHPHLQGPNCQAWIESLQELRELASTHIIVAGRGTPVSEQAIDLTINYLQMMQERIKKLVLEDQPPSDFGLIVPEFLSKFPFGTRPKAWVQEQIQLSLGYLYDEVKSSMLQEEI